MFEVGDVVEWCGVRGIVDRIDDVRRTDSYEYDPYDLNNLLVSFSFNDKVELVWFLDDGRLADWHTEPSLKLVERPTKKVKKVMYQAVMFLDEVGYEKYELTKEIFSNLDEAREYCSSNYKMHYEVIALGPAIEFEVDE